MTPVIALLALCTTRPQAQKLAGAYAVVRKLALPAPNARNKKELNLSKELDNFQAKVTGLSPIQAVKEWLKLVDQWERDFTDTRETGFFENDIARDLAAVISGPKAWASIRSGLRRRPQNKVVIELTLYLDKLLHDDRAIVRECRTFHKSEVGQGTESWNEAISFVELRAAVRLRSAPLIEEVLIAILRQDQDHFGIRIPDLVPAVGPAKAATILTRAIKEAKRPFYAVDGEATRSLAQAIYVKKLPRTRIPQWCLADSGHLNILLAMVKKFGVKNPEIGPSSEAEKLYFNYLLDHRQLQKAIDLIEEDPGETAQSVHNIEKTAPLFALLTQKIGAIKGAQIWSYYAWLAQLQGKFPEIAPQVDAALAKADIPKEKLHQLLLIKASLVAESGDIDGAIAAHKAAGLSTKDFNEANVSVRKLVFIANATGRTDALNAALEVMDKVAATASEKGIVQQSIFEALVDHGRLAEAQDRVLNPPGPKHNLFPFEVPEEYRNLAEIYYLGDRPKDVIGLFERGNAWTKADLADIAGDETPHFSNDVRPARSFGFLAGWAFAKTGRIELAKKCLQAALRSDLVLDEAYAVLNSFKDPSQLAFYDELTRIDSFEPRPLMWKADLLRELGRLPEAETLARRAIQLAPSDSESGPGRRLAAYSILANILKASGKDQEALTFDRTVQGIRLSEKADQLREADLLPQAEKLYRQSAELAPGAYCIHARLAYVLWREGKRTEALEQGRLAFQLLPQSLGETEYVCSECDDLFHDPQQQESALAIFEGMKRNPPYEAQIAYLVGSIYEARHETKNALAQYELAAHLDRRYVTAWNGILWLAHQALATRVQIEEATLALDRLDPLTLRHGWWDREAISDYRGAWNLYHREWAALPRRPYSPLLSLHGEFDNTDYRAEEYFPGGTRRVTKSSLWKGPSAKLAGNQTLREILQLWPVDDISD